MRFRYSYKGKSCVVAILCGNYFAYFSLNYIPFNSNLCVEWKIKNDWSTKVIRLDSSSSVNIKLSMKPAPGLEESEGTVAGPDLIASRCGRTPQYECCSRRWTPLWSPPWQPPIRLPPVSSWVRWLGRNFLQPLPPRSEYYLIIDVWNRTLLYKTTY